MNKKRVTLKDMLKKWWLATLIVLVCGTSDALTSYLFSAELFNEIPAVSILISVVLACGLDASLAILGNMLSAGRPDNQEALFRRKMATIGLISAFGLSYLALVLLAVAVSARNQTDIFTDGTLPRLILPAVTSVVSFFATFCMDPVAKDRARLDDEIAQTQDELDELDVESDRLSQGLQMYDCDQMDRLLCRASRLKIEVLQLVSSEFVREQLAKRIDDSDACRQILELDSRQAERLASIEAELNDLLETTDLAPRTGEEPAIRIVRQEEQAPAQAMNHS